MVCGLFSSFDPALFSSSLGVKWVVLGVSMLVVIGWQVFTVSTGVELVKEELVEKVGSIVSEVSSYGKDMMVGVYGLFGIVLGINFSGIIPYGMVSSAHLGVNLSISLPLWAAGVMLFFWNKFEEFASHFLPTGSPYLLWPFLVLVELVSWVIRPFTLGIRLMANIIAGHLITNLLSEIISLSSSGTVMYPVHLGLIIYELGVCMIQAYVFTSLVLMYCSESE